MSSEESPPLKDDSERQVVGAAVRGEREGDLGKKVSGQPFGKGSLPGTKGLYLAGVASAYEFPVLLMPQKS